MKYKKYVLYPYFQKQSGCLWGKYSMVVTAGLLESDAGLNSAPALFWLGDSQVPH
jgi:hypothetical protein